MCCCNYPNSNGVYSIFYNTEGITIIRERSRQTESVKLFTRRYNLSGRTVPLLPLETGFQSILYFWTQVVKYSLSYDDCW